MDLFEDLFLALRNFFTSSICAGGALVLLATVIIAFGPYGGTPQKGAVGLQAPKNLRAATVADLKIAPKDMLWQATTDTLACLSKVNIKKLQFPDAQGKSSSVRTLQSDAAKKDCVHVPLGTEVAVDAWDSDSGIAKVFVRRVGRRRYMAAKDIGRIDVRLRFRTSP